MFQKKTVERTSRRACKSSQDKDKVSETGLRMRKRHVLGVAAGAAMLLLPGLEGSTSCASNRGVCPPSRKECSLPSCCAPLRVHPALRRLRGGEGQLKLRFAVVCDSTHPGEDVGVLGNCEELGQWRNVVRMTAEKWPLWKVELPVSKGHEVIEYKYVKVYQDGTIGQWEPVENRLLCLKDVNPSDIRRNRLKLKDGEFGNPWAQVFPPASEDSQEERTEEVLLAASTDDADRKLEEDVAAEEKSKSPAKDSVAPGVDAAHAADASASTGGAAAAPAGDEHAKHAQSGADNEQAETSAPAGAVATCEAPAEQSKAGVADTAAETASSTSALAAEDAVKADESGSNASGVSEDGVGEEAAPKESVPLEAAPEPAAPADAVAESPTEGDAVKQDGTPLGPQTSPSVTVMPSKAATTTAAACMPAETQVCAALQV
jgi:hypothetical protein